jgi:hypothetical protein
LSAGFQISGETFWGTNGAVEEYVASLAEQASVQHGAGDPMAVFFRDELEGFFSGKIVFLDRIVNDAGSREKFAALLDLATEDLIGKNAFTPAGVEWVQSTMRQLRDRIRRDAE